MISERLKKVFLSELRLDDVEIVETTSADQIPGWDSLAHIRIIMAVEHEFRIRFKSVELMRLKTIMDLQKLVDSKCSRMLE